jgi:hypothetical protein
MGIILGASLNPWLPQRESRSFGVQERWIAGAIRLGAPVTS